VSLVVFHSVSLGFGKKQLVENLDLRIDHADRIGLVGPNGSGKSSIMKMLAHVLEPDAGSISRQNRLRIGYLPQELPTQGGISVLQTVVSSVPGRAELDEALAEAERAMKAAEHGGDEQAMLEVAGDLAEAHERIAGFDQHYSEHEARRILAGLGFPASDHDRDMGELSGGWQMRAHLAALLYQRPDLLLLDEPTNHLDLPTVAWFGDFLKSYPHAFVLICHDREFLNEQIGRVVSLEPEGVRQFRGDYEHYVKQRAEEEIVLENQAKNLQREREKAEQFINRFRAQANKAKAVQSRIKQLEKMDEVRTFERRKVMKFRFPPCDRAGANVLTVESLTKAYGNHVVLDHLDLTVQRGETIGIIGVNGAGKTTLLRTIAGELEPTGGSINLGHKVKVGYYAQHHADALDTSNTVFEEVAARNRGASETEVRTMLGAFLFSEEDVDKPIRVLSGGERARVALAKLLIDPGNFVLMDEPTNHLDLESSESLAESLRTYDGTLIFVSHNRSFIRTLATKIWNVEGGHVDEYPGTLDEYLERHRGDSGGDASPKPKAPEAEPKREAEAESAKVAKPDPNAKPAESREARRARKREEAAARAARNKKVGPLQKRITQLESEIATLEETQRQRNLQLADPALYEDAARRQQVLSDYQTDGARLAELTDQWELAQAELEELT
jgi:ATP-binding cassette subfamily F protein 3